MIRDVGVVGSAVASESGEQVAQDKRLGRRCMGTELEARPATKHSRSSCV